MRLLHGQIWIKLYIEMPGDGLQIVRLNYMNRILAQYRTVSWYGLIGRFLIMVLSNSIRGIQ